MFFLQLFLFQAVLFIALALILRRLMGRHATRATAHLAQLTQEYMMRQQELKKRLEETERHYEELMQKAEIEADRMRRKVLEEAEAQKRQILEEGRAESERIVSQGIRARDTYLRELEASIEKRVLERTQQLIQEILPSQLKEVVHHRWMEDLIQNGLCLEAKGMRAIESVREAEVTSAVPLTEEERKQLHAKLEKVLGRPIAVKETVDPKLIAGLTIALGHLVLDGSLAHRLTETVRRHAPPDTET